MARCPPPCAEAIILLYQRLQRIVAIDKLSDSHALLLDKAKTLRFHNHISIRFPIKWVSTRNRNEVL